MAEAIKPAAEANGVRPVAEGIADERGNQITVLARPGEQHRVFKRRAVQPFAAGGPREIQWIVGELDGVRCYVGMTPDGKMSAVLTRIDLNPTWS